MYGHHHDRVGVLVVFIDIGDQRVFLKEARQRRIFVAVLIFKHARNEFLKVFEPLFFGFAAVDKHLTVARALDDLGHEAVKRKILGKLGQRIYQRRKAEKRAARP